MSSQSNSQQRQVPLAATVRDEEDYPDVPDPDEDDLDDLDDLLDEFSVSQPPVGTSETKQASVDQPIPGLGADDEGPDISEEEFAKQLREGMSNLFGELEKSPEMQAQFEDLFRQIGAAAGNPDADTPLPFADPTASSRSPPDTTPASTSIPASAPTSAPAPSSANPSSSSRPTTSSSTSRTPGTEASFQETIRRTMERMQASGEQATAASAADNTDSFMAEMLKQLGGGGGGAMPGLGGEEGGEEDFSKMLMGMMEQLTNKEILYEPMKELHGRFPEWLAANRDKISGDDRARYEEQQRVVSEIVAKFEQADYSDENTAHREYIVERMHLMQEAGAPPPDLVGDIPSAQEAFGGGDEEACNPQ